MGHNSPSVFLHWSIKSTEYFISQKVYVKVLGHYCSLVMLCETANALSNCNLHGQTSAEIKPNGTKFSFSISGLPIRLVAWPSGLRRWFKAPVSSGAWVRIPPLPLILEQYLLAISFLEGRISYFYRVIITQLQGTLELVFS